MIEIPIQTVITNMTKKIKGIGWYWVLLCYCSDGDPLICGVSGSKKEAEELNEEVKDCGAKHKIKRCRVEITL